MTKKHKKSAIPSEETKKSGADSPPAIARKWIMPIRLAMSVAILGAAAYVFFHLGELEMTHFMIFIPFTAVISMIFLDCKMSERYWNAQDKLRQKEKE